MHRDLVRTVVNLIGTKINVGWKTDNIEAMKRFRDKNPLLHNGPSIKYCKTMP